MLSQEQIQELPGTTAYDRSEDKIGRIGTVYFDDRTNQPTWVTVNTGLFGTNESFVPVQGARVEGDRLFVDYDKQQVKDAPNVDEDGHLSADEEQKLFQYYGVDFGSAGTVADGTDGTDVSGRHAADERATGTVGHDTSGPTTDDAMTISEEKLRVGTEQVETGRARLRKHVVTENVTQTVPVSREEVRIEREPITDSNRGEAYDGPAISEEEHEVVLHAERPVVAKDVEAVERVRLNTETVTGEEQVSDEVRKERVDTDGVDTPRGGPPPMNDGFNILQSLQTAFTTLLNYLPQLLGALLVLLIGYIIAKVLDKAITAGLRKLRVDERLSGNPGGRFVEQVSPGGSPARLVGGVVFWVIMVFVISSAVGTLGIPAVTGFMNQVLAYLPNVIAALLIFVVAAAVAGVVGGLAHRTMGDTATGRVVRTGAPALIMAIAVFMILTQLGIAPVIVTATYIALVGAIALAAALAFGLGGRDAAAELISSGYRKVQDNADTIRDDLETGRERGRRDAERIAARAQDGEDGRNGSTSYDARTDDPQYRR